MIAVKLIDHFLTDVYLAGRARISTLVLIYHRHFDRIPHRFDGVPGVERGQDADARQDDAGDRIDNEPLQVAHEYLQDDREIFSCAIEHGVFLEKPSLRYEVRCLRSL